MCLNVCARLVHTRGGTGSLAAMLPDLVGCRGRTARRKQVKSLRRNRSDPCPTRNSRIVVREPRNCGYGKEETRNYGPETARWAERQVLRRDNRPAKEIPVRRAVRGTCQADRRPTAGGMALAPLTWRVTPLARKTSLPLDGVYAFTRQIREKKIYRSRKYINLSYVGLNTTSTQKILNICMLSCVSKKKIHFSGS